MSTFTQVILSPGPSASGRIYSKRVLKRAAKDLAEGLKGKMMIGHLMDHTARVIAGQSHSLHSLNVAKDGVVEATISILPSVSGSMLRAGILAKRILLVPGLDGKVNKDGEVYDVTIHSINAVEMPVQDSGGRWSTVKEDA